MSLHYEMGTARNPSTQVDSQAKTGTTSISQGNVLSRPWGTSRYISKGSLYFHEEDSTPYFIYICNSPTVRSPSHFTASLSGFPLMGRWSKRPQPAVSAARTKIFCLHVGYRLVHLPCQFSKNQPLDSLPTAFSYYDICNCTRWALVRSKRCRRPPWATLLIALDILRIRAHR